MKKLIYVFLVVLSVALFSCTEDKNSNPVNPQSVVLTDELRSKLSFAADSVFMRISTPGMMALFSAEGETDLVLKRGVSNLVTGELMNENYYFRIASNSKPFTGLAVLMLVDEGKINLDSSISYYLPQYNIPNGNLITVRMLGRMKSGLFNYSDDEPFWADFVASGFTKTYTPDSLLAIAFRHPVNFPPDADYEYCNTNTVLLGLLMEKVTGLKADEVIYGKIFRPVGLLNTFWPNTVFLPSPYIHGYSAAFGPLTEATNWNPSWGYTAGAIISNFSDMKIWSKIVADGTYLSPQMKAERFNWVNDHYGFQVMKVGNWIGHPGNMYGFNSHFLYHTQKKLTMLILTNREDNTPVEFFSDAFRRIIGN